MDNKVKLQTIAFEINDLLTEYITIHNKILKKAGSFLSLFKRVNFQEFYDDTKDILLKFNLKQREVRELKISLYDCMTHSQRNFLDCLLRYVDTLIETINLLYIKVDLLYQRSQNKISLRFKELQSVDKHYQKCINGYMRIGEELNDLYKEI